MTFFDTDTWQFHEYEDRWNSTGKVGHHGSVLGGDDLDITKWSREERAEAAFDKKDPLDDETIKRLKGGEQLCFC